MARRKRQSLTTPGTLYLLHFEPAYRGAGHYLGWTEEADPMVRVRRHMAGCGNPLVRAQVEAGGQVVVAELRAGTKADEKRLKARNGHNRWCPVCKAIASHAKVTADTLSA